MFLVSMGISVLLSASDARPELRFDTISVTANRTSTPTREIITTQSGAVSMQNVTVKSALGWAYELADYQISGPARISEGRYDIRAKTTARVTEGQLRMMCQELLTKHFKLSIHRETRALRVYVLRVARNGPRMTLGNPNGKSVVRPQGLSLNLSVRDTSMREVADLLSRVATQTLHVPPVVDMTGLRGRYNFSVDGGDFMHRLLQSRNPRGQLGLDPPATVALVQQILREQLGLQAELGSAPIEMLVVSG